MPMKYYEQIKNQEIPPMDTGDVPAFLVDIVISEDTEKPITSGLFRLEKGESLTYTYTYHEMKLIVDGTLIIEDETGQKKTGKVGDLFYFNKGTTVTFTTPDYGIGFFVGQRGEGEALQKQHGTHVVGHTQLSLSLPGIKQFPGSGGGQHFSGFHGLFQFRNLFLNFWMIAEICQQTFFHK